MGVPQEQFAKEAKANKEARENTLIKPSDGYFYAKREIGEALERRTKNIMDKRDKLDRNSDCELFMAYDAQIQMLEEVRSFVRNVMLWDTTKGE